MYKILFCSLLATSSTLNAMQQEEEKSPNKPTLKPFMGIHNTTVFNVVTEINTTFAQLLGKPPEEALPNYYHKQTHDGIFFEHTSNNFYTLHTPWGIVDLGHTNNVSKKNKPKFKKNYLP